MTGRLVAAGNLAASATPGPLLDALVERLAPMDGYHGQGPLSAETCARLFAAGGKSALTAARCCADKDLLEAHLDRDHRVGAWLAAARNIWLAPTTARRVALWALTTGRTEVAWAVLGNMDLHEAVTFVVDHGVTLPYSNEIAKLAKEALASGDRQLWDVVLHEAPPLFVTELAGRLWSSGPTDYDIASALRPTFKRLSAQAVASGTDNVGSEEQRDAELGLAAICNALMTASIHRPITGPLAELFMEASGSFDKAPQYVHIDVAHWKSCGAKLAPSGIDVFASSQVPVLLDIAAEEASTHAQIEAVVAAGQPGPIGRIIRRIDIGDAALRRLLVVSTKAQVSNSSFWLGLTEALARTPIGTEALLEALVGGASPVLGASWLSGALADKPSPGDVVTLARSEKALDILLVLGRAAETKPSQALVSFIGHVRGAAKELCGDWYTTMLYQGAHLFLSEVCGTSADEYWEVLALAENWEGSLAELVGTMRDLT